MMQAYTEYKDSGVDWLGDIPAEWTVKPGMVAFTENKRNNKGMKEDQVLSLSYGNIIIKPKEKLVGLVPESFETYQIIEAGDIIIRGTDLQNDKTSLRTGLAKDDGIITSAYLSLRVRPNFSSHFLHYYLHTLDTSKVIYKYGSGLRQNLSFEDFKRLPVFDIPLTIQTAIAEFLDDKTAKIEALVGIKRRQIKLLAERKQILIQNAVTKGLNPDAPMKDSGIDWIGTIPAHWEVKRLKFLCSIGTGGRNTEDKVENGKYPFYVRSQTAEQINSYSFDGEAILTAGDGAGVGKVYHYVNGKFDFHQRVYKFSGFAELMGKYLFHYISATFYSVAMLGTAKSTVDSLRLPLIQDFWVPFPSSVGEQNEIVAFVDEQVRKFELAEGLINNQITKLNEYKTTLINAAVTGKIKVVS